MRESCGSRLMARPLLITCVLVVSIRHDAGLRASDQPARGFLSFQSLREHIGSQEEVNLNVYFVGFPADLHASLRAEVTRFARDLDIKDAKPWYVPNRPRFEAEEFALAPDPTGQTPDGMVRYDATQMTAVPFPTPADPDNKLYVPNPGHDVQDQVREWQARSDVVNYLNHDGALVDVPWKVQRLEVTFLPASVLKGLYAPLRATQIPLTSANPAARFTLYSYNALLRWLDGAPFLQAPRGGGALVFLNLGELAGGPYSFFAEPRADLLPAIGNAPVEIQYPPIAPRDPQHPTLDEQTGALMSSLFKGGLTQPKMLAALELHCEATMSAADAGLVGSVPGIRPAQSVCARWSLRPIRNLVGNQGRHVFVADSTRPLAELREAAQDRASFLAGIRDDLWSLVKHGLLESTMRPPQPFSEAHELRMLKVDVRFEPVELCLLTKLGQGKDPATALAECQSESFLYPTEKTYELADVFDEEIATLSLRQYAPASWAFTYVDFPFVNAQDPTPAPLQSALFKAFLRDFLNRPTITNPATGLPVTIEHPPLYRKLRVLDHDNRFVELTSSWEKGLEIFLTQTLFMTDPPTGLGIYDAVWPDVQPKDTPPFHVSGQPHVHPVAFFLTPEPGGPTGESWGVAFWNLSALSALATSTYGAGGWWTTALGNDGGTLMARDYILSVPQYFLGKFRGLGEKEPFGVFPDGSVRKTVMPLLARPLELGAPVWCNEFRAADAATRAMARRHVKVTTSLQLIEPLEHALGYVHDPEPRNAFHFDGQQGSIQRLYELLQNPDDRIGHLLHSLVNQYTTAGISTVWGQTTSEWNSVSAQTGTRDSVLRAGAREIMADAEAYLAHAIQKLEAQGPDARVRSPLELALLRHREAKDHYDAWDYDGVIGLAQRAMSLTDQALTLMGEPDLIHDPLELRTARPSIYGRPSLGTFPVPALAELKRNIASARFEAWATAGPRH